ncbi:MAG: IS5 family transposase [Trebonia sp.]
MTKCKYCDRDDLRQCYDSDISDEGFAAIGPFLESRPKAKAGRPMEYAWRDIIDSVFYVLRTGCQWRQMPHDLVKWWVAYRWFRTLAKDGTWRRIHDGLHARVRTGEGRAPEPTACALDSQSAQSSEGGEAISFDKFKHCRGRKRHLAADTLGFLCERKVTGAGTSDRTAGREVLAGAVRRHPDLALAWADGGYANAVDDSLIAWARENTGIEVVVVKRTDDVKGFKILPRRWVIERTNAWISAHRRLAREYERLVECSEAMIDLAMIDVMAARLAGGTTWRHWRDMEPEPSVI